MHKGKGAIVLAFRSIVINMSEVPTPEAPKHIITVCCWKCKKSAPSTDDNIHSFFYPKQRYMDNTQYKCRPECNSFTVLFHDLVTDYPNLPEVAKEYPFTVNDFCDEQDILHIRKEITHAIDVVPHQLSARQVDQLDHLAAFLQTIEVTVDDFVLPPAE